MTNSLQQVYLAQLRHEELLAEAAIARQVATARVAHPQRMAEIMHRVSRRWRKWFTTQRVRVDPAC